MRVFAYVAGATALAPPTLALPARPNLGPSTSLGRSFSLQASSHRSGALAPNFVTEWAAAHQKWGKGVPDSAKSAWSLADDGRINVQPMAGDVLYIADIQLGSPPQSVKMAVDTGSGDLWVQSTDTEYEINRHGPWPPLYRPNMSDTAELIDMAQWDVEYVDGTAASGIVYKDSVRLGNFEVPNAAIQSAETVASQFEDELGLSGILGLAKSLPSNIEPPLPSFLELLRPELDSPVFTVDLRRNASGRFDFGYIDETLAADNITWVDSMPNSNHWDVQFDLTSWTSNLNTWYFQEFVATIDTGTSLLFLPPSLANGYWYSVPGMRVDPDLSDAFTFPCDIEKNLPDLLFKLPGTEHVLRIPGPYLSFGPVAGDSVDCWGGMQSAANLNAVIIGDVMLKALFVAFDLDQDKVGFANKRLDDLP